jgi:dihydroxyacetone kinase-like protein
MPSAAEGFSTAEGRPVIDALIEGIHQNAARLSKLDGATGDGDHGINMDKGFQRAGELLGDGPVELQRAFSVLGRVLVTEIGGAMGPLYGSFYLDMAGAIDGADRVDAQLFDGMIAAGAAAIEDLGEAKLGDKTLLDTLLPAQGAYREALARSDSFVTALAAMAEAGEHGAEATRDMVARVGRASRLGERSRGFLDAGAVSCAIQLRAMADAMSSLVSTDPAAGAD